MRLDDLSSESTRYMPMKAISMPMMVAILTLSFKKTMAKIATNMGKVLLKKVARPGDPVDIDT